jgi:hypothetical protein
VLTCNRCPVSYHLSCSPAGITRLNRKAILCVCHKEGGPSVTDILDNVSAYRRKEYKTIGATGAGDGIGDGDGDKSASKGQGHSEHTPGKTKRSKRARHGEELFCICQKPAMNDDELWVSCDGCGGWFHPECVGLDPNDVHLLPSYFCKECE